MKRLRKKNLQKILKYNHYLSIIFDHDVAIVSVPYAQDKSGYTVSCTRPCEQIYGLVIPKTSNKFLKKLILIDDSPVVSNWKKGRKGYTKSSY